MKKVIVVFCLSSLVLSASAKIELGTPFADGMVLQRDRAVPVWGKAEPGRKITVAFAGETVTTVACECGEWRVDLPAMPASKESRTLTVTEGETGWLRDTDLETVELKDVLVGEVWLCAGQSNTDCPIWGASPRYRDGWGAMMLTSVNKPFVRFVKTSYVASTTPRFGYRAEWRKATPDLYQAYVDEKKPLPSAIGYYYALEMANALDIPVGLVDSSWGGTNIDAWTPRSGYRGLSSLADVAALPVLDEKAFNASKKGGVYKDKGIYGGWIQQPTALWNGMVAAYAPMACRGFIWYQGCHNSCESNRYCDKMHALYNGWATEFANPDLKLYFVQLTPWGSDVIPAIQMAQAKFAAEEKNAAMAVINDVGNLRDIHPNDKRTVAKRLSLHALRRDYGWTSVRDNSPTLKSWKVEDDQFVLSFNDADGWYVYNPDNSLAVGFEVCGEDGAWKPAEIVNILVSKDWQGKDRRDGRLVGRDLIVRSKDVKKPVKLRYLHSAPWFGSLYNDVCLPLGAFEIGQ